MSYRNMMRLLNVLSRPQTLIPHYLSLQFLKLKHQIEFGIIPQITKIRRFNDALQCYDQFLKINPNNFEAFCNIGHVLNYELKINQISQIREFDQALYYYEKALKVNATPIISIRSYNVQEIQDKDCRQRGICQSIYLK